MLAAEVGSPNTIKYTLSNAPADTPLLLLGQMQGQRWVERTFEDAKGDCGLADFRNAPHALPVRLLGPHGGRV